MTDPAIYGELEPLAKVKGHDLVAECTDPNGRFVAYRRGLTVVVLDLSGEVPAEVAVHKDATSTTRCGALSPDGRGIAIRSTLYQTLQVRHGDGRCVEIDTETTLTDWRGNPLPTRSPAPRWGYGDEAVAWSADGEHVALASHLPDGQACVVLYRAEDLSVVDVLSDFPLHAGYGIDPDDRTAAPWPLDHWSETIFEQDPLDPGLLLGIRNAGDGCCGVVAIRVRDGALESVAPNALGHAVFQVDDYALRRLRRTPDGLLVLDRDFQLGLVAWPPDPDRGVLASRFVGDHLRPSDGYGIEIPWYPGQPESLSAGDELTIASDHILIDVDEDPSWRTIAMIAYAPDTLEPMGLVRRPRSRLRFTTLRHLGHDTFAGVGSNTIQLWRLHRATP